MRILYMASCLLKMLEVVPLLVLTRAALGFSIGAMRTGPRGGDGGDVQPYARRMLRARRARDDRGASIHFFRGTP